jgi:hypothetical protein
LLVTLDDFVKSQKPAFRSWFDTCLTDGRQTSPRTEIHIVTAHSEKRRFVIASEAKQSHNAPDLKEIATALCASQ